jgi:hypothetical protein
LKRSSFLVPMSSGQLTAVHTLASVAPRVTRCLSLTIGGSTSR